MLIKRFIYLLIFFVTLSYSNDLSSQTFKNFSENHEDFINEMTIFLQKTNKKEEKKIAKEFMETFAADWNAGIFTEEQEQQIYKISNLMLKRKMRPFPYFKKYLTALLNFANSNQTEESFMAWSSGLEKLINMSNTRQFISYLEIINNLITDNIIYESYTTKWQASNNDWYFKYDNEPKIIFNYLDLTCYSKGDSSCIYNTKGTYYPIKYEWKGQEGKVDWQRAGLDKDDVYAKLRKYTINVKFSKYSADTVTFYNKNYFYKPLLGKLTEKIKANVTEEKSLYPRFDSYNKHLKIKEIFENIDYEGGFSMRGSKFIGSGDKKRDTYLIFKKDGKKFLVTASKAYAIRKDRISAQRASVTIYYEKDSIYHPGLQVRYIDDKKELSLLRLKQGLAESPYFDSFHKLDIYVEALYWKLDEPKIDMKMIKGIGNVSKAIFESNNYYSEQRFSQLQGIDEINPLLAIKKYSKKINSKEFFLKEFAEYMRKPYEQIKASLIKISNMGFIMYNLDHDKIIIKDRLYDYLNAKVGKTDYDVIKFNSVISGKSNASINLLNFDLKLRGIARIFLSDSKNVYIYPKNQELIMKKNRDFTFSGRVHAGLFDFYGKEFSFEYDNFKVNLPNVDSLTFKVHKREKDELGNYPLVKVKNSIEGLSGNLLIDLPNNKSGAKPSDEYPIFNSKTESYVYFDKKNILNGIYTKDKFYFHIDPFSLDSLDNFNADNIAFEGYLKSSDIFPDIDEPLKVQPDYSLGFVKNTQESGLPAYGGKGQYFSIIDLSNKGLRGNGSLKYLTSTSESNNFIFSPDSMNANLQYYEIKEQIEQVEYPTVTAEDVYEQWFPYRDLMIVSKKQKPIKMYNSESDLHGSITLAPSGLAGKGIMKFEDIAEVESKLFDFKQHVFDADTADFRLRTYDLSKLSLATYNYKAHIDFDKRKGKFESNIGGSKVDFPVNQYICFMNEFDWYMDKAEIELASNKNMDADLDTLSLEELSDVDLKGSKFISVHPDQDSLGFYSPRAKYSLKDNIIYATDVKVIKIADAVIFPDKGNVTILKEAKMQTLDNALIMANTTTKYHIIYDAMVDVFSRKNYEAVGKYDYIDETKTKQQIYFNKIAVDSTTQTYACGIIDTSANFTLSPYFEYTGKVNLLASKEFLNFDGFCKIKHDCDTLISWLKFKADIDPNEIYIPVSQKPKDINDKNITASILISNDSNNVYSSFLYKKYKYSNQEIISSDGFLTFDSLSQEYRISTKDKLKESTLPGNYLSLNRNDCITYGEGEINLTDNLGQTKIKTYGNVSHYIISDSTYFDLLMSLDFFFSDKAIKIISNSLEQYYDLEPVDITRETVFKALYGILSKEKADKLISDITMYGFIKKYPSELKHTLLLTDVQFKWDSETKSYISQGPIGIGSINKAQINKYVNGYIEIVKKRSGDEITVYLEPEESEWYFFNYRRGIMQIISSDKIFNEIIRETKPEDRKMKTKGKEMSYSYTLSSLRKKKSFLKKFQPDVIEEPDIENTEIEEPDNE